MRLACVPPFLSCSASYITSGGGIHLWKSGKIATRERNGPHAQSNPSGASGQRGRAALFPLGLRDDPGAVPLGAPGSGPGGPRLSGRQAHAAGQAGRRLHLPLRPRDPAALASPRALSGEDPRLLDLAVRDLGVAWACLAISPDGFKLKDPKDAKECPSSLQSLWALCLLGPCFVGEPPPPSRGKGARKASGHGHRRVGAAVDGLGAGQA